MSWPSAPRTAPDETDNSPAHGARLALSALCAVLCCLGVVRDALADDPGVDPHSRPPLMSTPAPEPQAAPPVRFDGGHLGPLLGLGLGLFDGPDGGGTGWDLRLGLRYASLLQLLDLAAWAELGAHPTSAGSAIDRQALGADLSLHPLFWVLVWDSLAGWLAAGLHGYASAGLARVSLAGPSLVARAGGYGQEATHWAALAEVGFGLDAPLSGRAASSGLWLSLRWGLRWLTVGEAGSAGLDLGDHHVSLALSWRSYGALSNRACRRSRWATQSTQSSPSSSVQRNRM